MSDPREKPRLPSEAGREADHEVGLSGWASLRPGPMRRESEGAVPSTGEGVLQTDPSPTPMPVVEGVPPAVARSSVTSRFRAGLGGGLRRTGTIVRASATAIAARPRRALTVVGAMALLGAVVPFVALRTTSADTKAAASTSAGDGQAKTTPLAKPYVPPSGLTGLDLKSIAVDDTGAVASAISGRVAHLTLDPQLQNATMRLLAKHKVPQASVVVMDPATGKVLTYASRGGDGKDLAVEAFAPSASVFKIVTGATLVQVAGVPIDTKLCYSGGEQKILASDLKDDPKHDVYCATLAQAMGRSINVIFAKLASRKLTAPDLAAIGGQLGYGTAIPFDVPVEVSKLDLPADPLEFARTAAGFWHSTLSPLHGAVIASSIANGGVMMRPYVVSDVVDGTTVVYKAPAPSSIRKAIEPATAIEVGKMMSETVSQGTCFKAFHDAKGKAFIPGVEIAGKTGTLNQPSPLKLFTWFVGFAPAKNPKVAIAVLVVNDPVWKVKANVIGREVLQAYFAEQGTPGVVSPSTD